MKLQMQISDKIKDLFDYHEYQISKVNLIRLSNAFIEIKKDLSLEYFEKFLKDVELGKYGILYRMPTCLLSMFQKYNQGNKSMMP